MNELDKEIAKCEEQIRINTMPMRMRYNNLASNDGYEDYVTEAETIASAIFVNIYNEKLRCLRQLKKLITEEQNNGNND